MRLERTNKTGFNEDLKKVNIWGESKIAMKIILNNDEDIVSVKKVLNEYLLYITLTIEDMYNKSDNEIIIVMNEEIKGKFKLYFKDFKEYYKKYRQYISLVV